MNRQVLLGHYWQGRTKVCHHCPCKLSAFCILAPPAACLRRTGRMRYPAHRQTATAGEQSCSWGAVSSGGASATHKRSPESPGSSSCCWQRGSAPHSGRSSLQTKTANGHMQMQVEPLMPRQPGASALLTLDNPLTLVLHTRLMAELDKGHGSYTRAQSDETGMRMASQSLLCVCCYLLGWRRSQRLRKPIKEAGRRRPLESNVLNPQKV
jgi:hypothetical protein